eukprot:scaffold46981_cov21-Tisochrysis_lutea.AAC.2
MIHITKPRLQAPVSLPMSGHPKQKGPQGMCHVAATAASHAFLTFAGETVEGSVRGVQQTCEQLGLEHEYYADPEGMRKKWEQIRPGEKYEGVYEATAGSVNASLSCATMMGQAQQRGWSLMENTRYMLVLVAQLLACVASLVATCPPASSKLVAEEKLVQTPQNPNVTVLPSKSYTIGLSCAVLHRARIH